LKSFTKLIVALLIGVYTAFGLTYTVKPGDSLNLISKKFGVSVVDIIKENNLKKPYVIYPGQKLKIPTKKKSKHRKVKIIKINRQKPSYLYTCSVAYKVRPGDSLLRIAKKFKVSVNYLKKLNNLKSNLIHPGQTLCIKRKVRVYRKYTTKPPKKTYKRYTTKKTKPSVSPKPKKVKKVYTRVITYTVRPGDSLYLIAKRFGTTVDKIRKLNNLRRNSIIRPGQKLKVIKKEVVYIPIAEKPKKETKIASKTTQPKKDFYIKREKRVYKRIITYRVKPGDSLYLIAKKFGTTVSRLRQLNRLGRKSVIHPGQKLKVEKKEIVYRERIIKSNVSFGFEWPVKGKVVKGFVNNAKERHLGIEIETDCLTPVRSAEDGRVMFADKIIKSYGNTVIVRHSNKFSTTYGHLEKMAVKSGKIVRKGEIIGYTGKIDDKGKCGVYFEIRKDGKPLDPLVFLEKEKKQ